MRRKLAIAYAMLCTLLLVAGCVVLFTFAWKVGVEAMGKCVFGLVLGFVLAPVLHELGHYTFALANNMRCVYLKCFCFRFVLENGKKRFSFASPFGADETQVIPKSGGNMKKRARRYAVGGLVFSGIFLTLLLVAGVLTTVLGETNYFVWGLVPYFVYLFILNLPAVEYANGKTDGLVCKGLHRGYDAERVMISAMEIQGRLYEGKRFSEIDESLYFDLPQLCEEEPLYAVILDLRYRYFLDKDEPIKAGECLNRLLGLQAYLPEQEIRKIAMELTYMHAVSGNVSDADAIGQLCKEELKKDTATAKRVLIAYCKASGKLDSITALKEQAKSALEKEPVKGIAEFERRLISKLTDKKTEKGNNTKKNV